MSTDWLQYRILITGLIAILLVACGQPSSPAANAKDPPASKSATPTARSPVREQLDIGYSLLYQEANGIPKMSIVLALKDKSAEAGAMIDATMALYRTLATSLEALAAQNPQVRIDVAPMSEIEGDTRKAIGLDQIKDFAPLVGKSGTAFERELLLMFYNALDEQRHLVGVMLERETDPPLKDYLRKTKDQLETQHGKIEKLLERSYFSR